MSNILLEDIIRVEILLPFQCAFYKYMKKFLSFISDANNIGLFLSIIWIALITFLIDWKWHQALNMSLSEWGGFLSGVTAPLAFLWFYVGYRLQRKEIHSNTESLKEQIDVLKKQADCIDKIVVSQRQQAVAALTRG